MAENGLDEEKANNCPMEKVKSNAVGCLLDREDHPLQMVFLRRPAFLSAAPNRLNNNRIGIDGMN